METSKDHFNQVASIYLKKGGVDVHKHHAQRKAEIISSISQKNDIILDVGCGVGEYLTLLDKAHSVQGIDFSQEMISISNSKTKSPLYIGDATSLPFKNNSFDLVYCVGLLHHLKKPDKVYSSMKELARVSKRDVLIFDLNYTNPFCRYLIIHLCPWDEGDERIPTKNEVLKNAKSTGMELVSIQHKGFLPYGTPKSFMKPASQIEDIFEKKIPLLATSIIYHFKVVK